MRVPGRDAAASPPLLSQMPSSPNPPSAVITQVISAAHFMSRSSFLPLVGFALSSALRRVLLVPRPAVRPVRAGSRQHPGPVHEHETPAQPAAAGQDEQPAEPQHETGGGD